MRLERFDGETDHVYMSGNTSNEVVTRTVDTEQKQYGTSPEPSRGPEKVVVHT
jgi:hypothetical protein